MLTGIAKLAAESVTLESKRQVEYFEMEARSILNRTKPGMPFDWTINPYRGCEFGCKYCYARDTHEFMEQRAARPDLRIEAVGTLAKADIAVGVYASPVLPLINDSERSLSAVAKAAKDAGARYFGGNVLFLKSASREVFFAFLQEHYPH